MNRSAGITALSVFFAFGACMALLACAALVTPGGVLEPMWRINPEAREGLARLAGWGPVLMLCVAVACALAAIGTWIRAAWGHRLAVGLLAINLLGDLLNAMVRGDRRTLIGIPIAGALIVYLLLPHTRARFENREARGVQI